MRKLSLAVASVFLVATAYSQQAGVVLVEIFTNSHCSPCAGAHTAATSIITSTHRASNAIVVYNHWRTYQDDPIYQANKVQPEQRAAFLGGVSGTPTIFFNGTRQTGSYNNWAAVLDGLISVAPSYTVAPVLTFTADSLILTYTVTGSGSGVTPTVYGLLVENITYAGRNGISDHDGSMRALFTPVEGSQLDFRGTTTATGRVAIARQQLWDVEKVRAVVSVQDPATKKSMHAAQISATSTINVNDETGADLGAATTEVVAVTGVVVSRRHDNALEDNQIVSQVTGSLSSGAYFVRIVRGTSVKVYPIAITR